VYTNLDSVALSHDGTAVGTSAVENARVEWTLPLRAGDNTLVARAPDGPAIDQTTVHYDDRSAFFAKTNEDGGAMAINTGRDYRYTDRYGVVWEADRAAEGRRKTPWEHTGGEATRTHHRIVDTDEDPLFQAAHTGASQYHFEVPPGRYAVDLGFAELAHDAPDERVFDVRLNGRLVLDDLDLAEQFGRYRAVRTPEPGHTHVQPHCVAIR
jgi:beta-galactosidase